jgi:putative membrane protein
MVLMIKGVREIFRNDIKAIRENPVVIFVLIVIIFIPSLYALLNIQATWDPYARTSNIEVAVVNEDIGYNTNGTSYNIGNILVGELKNNGNFSWQFVNKTTAMNGVKSGDYYAALIIPNNFSQDLLSIQSSTPQQAHIQYIVNDKTNPIAPRITTTGVDAIQAEINNEVVKTIDGIIFGKLSDVGQIAKENKAQFLQTRAFINELNGKIGVIDSTLGEANSDMNTVNDIWPKVSAALPEVQKYSNEVRTSYDTLYNQIESNPHQALKTVQNMELQTNTAIVSLKYVDAVLTSLYDTTGDEQLKTTINQVENDITMANQVNALLKEIETDINNGNNPKGKLSQLKTLIDQMDDGVNILVSNKASINQEINDASSKLSVVNSKWPLIRSEIPIAAAKLNSINESDLDKLIAFSSMDQNDVQNYFKTPVTLDKQHMYPINNYGSALAPFYISISLWIGCIIAVAMIAMRVRSVKKYSSESVYLGRMGIFIIISLLQALFVSIGALYLHVQMTSALLFVFTTLFIGLCAMLVVYSLTSTFGNAGKAFAIIILVLQITATGGTFPVEILPPFFQYIHPFLPLTYAIEALREVIAGIIWSNYWYDIGILAVFPAVAVILSLLIKEKSDKAAQWTETKLEKSGLF